MSGHSYHHYYGKASFTINGHLIFRAQYMPRSSIKKGWVRTKWKRKDHAQAIICLPADTYKLVLMLEPMCQKDVPRLTWVE